MRVEDLDPGRSREEHRISQLDDLRWLGIDWDEGPDLGGPFPPYLQSERGEVYEAALDVLRRKELVYACDCSRKEIAAAASAPHASDDEGPAYSGRCASRNLAENGGGKPCALRFRVPDGEVRFQDEVLGEMSFTPSRETGDFVVRRKDGVASYQLAVVVDDAEMEITDVVRGEDLLPSTARQILLYQALGFQAPRWYHVPLLLDAKGERLSKRYGALSVGEYREAGIPAERLVGWLASSCGLSAEGDEMSADELIPRFNPEALGIRPRAAAPSLEELR